jgi:hypothetical protein
VEAAILAALPPEGKVQSKDDTLTKFQAIKDGKLLEFAGSFAEQVFSEADGVLQAIIKDRVPTWPSGKSLFMQKLKAGFARLLHCQTQDKGKEITIFGEQAVKLMFKQADAMKEQGRSVEYSTLTPLIVYAWLLPPTEYRTVCKWKEGCLAAVQSKSKASIASSSSSSSTCAAGLKKRADAKGQTKSLVADLWK